MIRCKKLCNNCRFVVKSKCWIEKIAIKHNVDICVVEIPRGFKWKDFSQWCKNKGYTNVHSSQHQELVNSYLRNEA